MSTDQSPHDTSVTAGTLEELRTEFVKWLETRSRNLAAQAGSIASRKSEMRALMERSLECAEVAKHWKETQIKS
jgi:hypothetical protein